MLYRDLKIGEKIVVGLDCFRPHPDGDDSVVLHLLDKAGRIARIGVECDRDIKLEVVPAPPDE